MNVWNRSSPPLPLSHTSHGIVRGHWLAVTNSVRMSIRQTCLFDGHPKEEKNIMKIGMSYSVRPSVDDVQLQRLYRTSHSPHIHNTTLIPTFVHRNLFWCGAVRLAHIIFFFDLSNFCFLGLFDSWVRSARLDKMYALRIAGIVDVCGEQSRARAGAIVRCTAVLCVWVCKNLKFIINLCKCAETDTCSSDIFVVRLIFIFSALSVFSYPAQALACVWLYATLRYRYDIIK